MTLRAGKLVAWKVREFCEDAVAAGYRLQWRESRGWVQSTFYIEGDDGDVDDLANQLRQFGNIENV